MPCLNLTTAHPTVKNGLKAKKIKLPQFFILQNFQKNLRADPELWGCAIFEPRMAHLPWAIFFKSTSHCYYFHLPIGPFHCAKFKKNSYSRSRVMRMHNFWAQNGPFPQMRIFFRKPVNEPCFFHSCLSTCQKSKPDINLLVKYWLLKNTEISLAKSHFWL